MDSSVRVEVLHYVPEAEQRQKLISAVRVFQATIGEFLIERGVADALDVGEVKLRVLGHAVRVHILHGLAQIRSEQQCIRKPAQVDAERQVRGVQRDAEGARR